MLYRIGAICLLKKGAPHKIVTLLSGAGPYFSIHRENSLQEESSFSEHYQGHAQVWQVSLMTA
jgi:hypothetical protein